MKKLRKIQIILSSSCKNKRLQRQDWWQKRFWWTIRNHVKTYENIRKIATGQGDDYTTGCLLDYPYFKEHKILVIDSSKHRGLDADPKSSQQINYFSNLNCVGNTTMLFILEEVNQILDKICFRFFS